MDQTPAISFLNSGPHPAVDFFAADVCKILSGRGGFLLKLFPVNSNSISAVDRESFVSKSGKWSSTRLILGVLLVALIAVGNGGFCSKSTAASPPAGTGIDFNQHVRPILTQHCTACHGGVKVAAGVSFAYEKDLLSIVEPHAADESSLIERVTTKDGSYRMPPEEHGPPLSEREIDVLRAWINQGAKWSKHWAYEVPVWHEPPNVTRAEWPRQKIDYFVLRHLDEVGAAPAEEEEAAAWLRRVSLDLTGLPPTMDERSSFLAEVEQLGEPAYEAAVDRLLASKQYGERWASVWFDLVRYADSRGSSEDSPRDIWKYRDWVIDALNADVPYDEFTKKQLAGDLLPNRTIEDRLATSVHRLTASNEEGGTDDEEFRVAAILDRVDTVWQTWQGTTMGCVQCHDHPYEPIAHEEFYRFMAYFNNTADCDLTDDWPTLDVPLDEEDYAQASQLDRRIESLQQSLWEEDWRQAHHEPHWRRAEIKAASTSNATKLKVVSKEGHERYRTVGTVARKSEITTKLALPADMTRVTAVRMTALPLDEESAKKDAEVGFVMSHIKVSLEGDGNAASSDVPIAAVIGDEPFPYSDPGQSLRKNEAGFGAYTRIHHPRNVVLILKKPAKVSEGARIVLKVRYGVFDLAAFSLIARSGEFAVTDEPRLTQLLADEQRLAQQARLTELQKAREAIKSIATPVLMERPVHLARPSHRFDRGLFLTKAEQVKPAVPEVLNSSRRSLPDRLAMADWLVSEENPLTARVMVNRLWARMFEIGLVPTEGDFGAAGDMPSHPELLDDLAVRFREDYQWSIKRLLRELALSSVYRQSSRVVTDFHRGDPQNRLLARGPRKTLPAEGVRDQMLAVSGLLNLEMEGPPVYPPIPPGVWKVRRGSWKEHKVGEPDRYRRSVYTYVKRSAPFPMFATFDAPSRDVCVTRRLRSNTPLQALMTLNDEAAHECAEALASRMREESEVLDEQIRYGFMRTTSRPPDAEELRRLTDLYREAEEVDGAESALRTVATLLLNLDLTLNN